MLIDGGSVAKARAALQSMNISTQRAGTAKLIQRVGSVSLATADERQNHCSNVDGDLELAEAEEASKTRLVDKPEGIPLHSVIQRKFPFHMIAEAFTLLTQNYRPLGM